MKNVIFYFFSFLVAMYGCNPKDTEKPDDEILAKDTTKYTCTKMLPVSDTTFQISEHDVSVKLCTPDEKKGTFLLLHGWNFPADDWCTKTKLCSHAIEDGYCVVMPHMGKSNFHTNIYPETRPDYSVFPGLLWLTETVIPELQKMCLLVDGERNFIVGLSTGGRGVAMVCQQMPWLFTGAAALSGDFDQSAIPNDRVHQGFWGPYNQFPERWTTIENPVFRISEMQTPIYLGHGLSDKVTPYSQSQLFYDSLKKHNPSLKTELHLPEAGHDYEYWASEVDNIMRFFRGIE